MFEPREWAKRRYYEFEPLNTRVFEALATVDQV